MARKLNPKYARAVKASSLWLQRSTADIPPVGARACLIGPVRRAEYETTSWRRAHDRAWRIYSTTKTLCGRRLGNRIIDNKRHVVITVGNRFFAAEPDSVRRPA